MAGVDRHGHRSGPEAVGQRHPVGRIDVLDILDDDGDADILRPGDHLAQGIVAMADQLFPGVRLVVVIVVAPGGEGAVGDHLGGAEGFADLQPLQQALAHHGLDVRILGGDGEAPERAVDAEPSGMAVEQRLGALDQRHPVAVEHRGIEEILKLQVAGFLEQPVSVGFDHAQRHGRAKDRKIGHGGNSCRGGYRFGNGDISAAPGNRRVRTASENVANLIPRLLHPD